MYKILLILLGLSFAGFSSSANQRPVDPLIAKCGLTPKMSQTLPFPNSFYRTNNLVRKTGSFAESKGRKITIAGRLMDKNCVPIENGVIRLWQADNNGHLSYSPEDKNIKHSGDTNFAGTGVANSNNLGRFIFYTIYPGLDSKYGATKFVNLLVESGKNSFITKLYFDELSALKDGEFVKLNKANRDNIVFAHSSGTSQGEVYFIDIVMDYVQINRTY